jgi:hypothetical protein
VRAGHCAKDAGVGQGVVRVRCAVSMRALKRRERLEAAHSGRVRATQRAATLRVAATPGLYTVARASASLAGDVPRSKVRPPDNASHGATIIACATRRRGFRCWRALLSPRIVSTVLCLARLACAAVRDGDNATRPPRVAGAEPSTIAQHDQEAYDDATPCRQATHFAKMPPMVMENDAWAVATATQASLSHARRTDEAARRLGGAKNLGIERCPPRKFATSATLAYSCSTAGKQQVVCSQGSFDIDYHGGRHS